MNQKTFKFLLSISLLPIFLAFFLQPADDIFHGLIQILRTRDILITDYFAIGGIGATLLNAGLVSLLSVMLIKISKGSMCGSAIASVFLMFGFSFFGKNILNILPILFGTFLYSFVFKEKYSSIVHVALLATCFAPIFDEVYYFIEGPVYLKLIGAVLTSMSFGFITKPVSRMAYHAHDGYNLYNVGFAAGLMGIIYVSLMKSSGYQPTVHTILYNDASSSITGVLLFLFSGTILAAFALNRTVFTSYRLLLKESGYKDNDFVTKFGFETVLLNMGLNGLIGLFYILVIAKGSLNGPVIGSLLTVVGFSGLGKHPRNTIPLYLGVILGSLTKTWSLNEPAILLIALFGTALAPIAGSFGILAGVIAAYLNSSVVMNTAAIHGNINLYNSGFSCGIVASVLVPIFKMISDHSERFKTSRKLTSFMNNTSSEDDLIL